MRCVVGVNDEERRDKQDVVVNITLAADLRPASERDDVAAALDYRAVKKRVLRVVEDSRFFLLEALAESIAAVCLESERVHEARVTVDKPGALRFARSVAVEITRSRGRT